HGRARCEAGYPPRGRSPQRSWSRSLRRGIPAPRALAATFMVALAATRDTRPAGARRNVHGRARRDAGYPPRGRSPQRSWSRSLRGGIPAPRALAATFMVALAATRDTRPAGARRNVHGRARRDAGYPPRGRSPQRSWSRSLRGGIPAPRALAATFMVALAARRDTRPAGARRNVHGRARCDAGYPPRGRSPQRSWSRSPRRGIPAPRALAATFMVALAATRDTRPAGARRNVHGRARRDAGYPPRGRSPQRSWSRSPRRGIPAPRALAATFMVALAAT